MDGDGGAVLGGGWRPRIQVGGEVGERIHDIAVEVLGWDGSEGRRGMCGVVHSIKSTRYRSSVSSSPRRHGSSRCRRSRSGKFVAVFESMAITFRSKKKKALKCRHI